MQNIFRNEHEFNFIAEDVNDFDAEMFMGPFEDKDGPIIRFPSSWTMAHIMHEVGIFKSVTEARKNGWDKPIAPGFQHMTVTKRKIPIWILNKLESAS